jgi:hypothetical protein
MTLSIRRLARTTFSALLLLAPTSALAHGDNVLEDGSVFLATLNSGQVISEDGSTSAAMGWAVATYKKGQLCVTLTLSGLEGTEAATVVAGPAGFTEHAPHDGGQMGTVGQGDGARVKNRCMPLTSQQAKTLKRGKSYLQVNTVERPGAEIRGQLVRMGH